MTPFWGKLLGALFGFMFGKLPGAVLGLFVGHLFDKGYSQDFSQSGGFARFFTSENSVKQQAVFFHSLFSALGHVAKADGQVSPSEIRIATDLMDQMGLQGETRQEAQQAFREGKERDFPLKQTLQNFSGSCHGRRDIQQMFLEILIQAAYADGHLHSAEQQVLEDCARYLGFKQNAFLYLLSMHEAEQRFRQHGSGQRRNQATSEQNLQDAYKILGVTANDDAKTVKKAYRKLMSEHHPDKLVAKGLPKQAMEIAKTKAQDIQAAYELIKRQRAW